MKARQNAIAVYKLIKYNPAILANKIILRVCERLYGYGTFTTRNKLCARLSAKHVCQIREYYKDNYSSEILKCEYAQAPKPNESVNKYKNNKIWVAWLQGIDAAPKSVKYFLDRICRNANGHEVIFLDENSIDKYITVPPDIKEKYRLGTVLPAHFADYIRVSILEKYGGVWLDSSLLVVSPIPKYIFEVPIWSPKGMKSFPMECLIPSGNEWQVYAIAGRSGHVFYSTMRRVIEKCIRANDYTVDYYATYYISELAREINKTVRHDYNELNPNNSFCEGLAPVLLNPHRDLNEIKKLVLTAKREGTWFFKLTTQTFEVLENTGISNPEKYIEEILREE